MTREELKTDIDNEITFSRSMPYSLPDKELDRIIDIARNYFWDNWRYATQERYMLLPLELFKTDEFKKHRIIKLPECIRFVHGMTEIKNMSVFGTIDRDFSEQKFIGSEIFLTPFMGESIVYRTVMFSFLDLTKKLVLDDISYDHNKNNHQLFVKGHDPKTPVVLKCSAGIEEHDLFEDEMYQRYTRAKAKVRLGEQLSVFKYNLPGGVEINYEVMVTKAEEELKSVVEEMDKENVPNYMEVISD